MVKNHNLSESIQHRLKNLSKKQNRPFDEVLRYFAIERLLYRLSKSPYTSQLFLKGGQMLRVWDSQSHRATLDVDFLARISNKQEKVEKVFTTVLNTSVTDDGLTFQKEKWLINPLQVRGRYAGIRLRFNAFLYTARIPVLIDIGFNDTILPAPEKFYYPTLLPLPAPYLLGYNRESLFAEKFESIISLGILNTRMKDFYDLWRLIKTKSLNKQKLKKIIIATLKSRETTFEFPDSFQESFLSSPETKKRWDTFLKTLRHEEIISLEQVAQEISEYLEIETTTSQM